MINISNIERFATHDGPGIRTVIFFKGCSLHCPWCANPETWTVAPVLMHDAQKCVRCMRCQDNCKNKAIRFDPNFHWQSSQCTHCQKCVENCMVDALEFSGKAMSIDEIVNIVLKDKDYYEMSGGGVTISGGECMVQSDGLIKLIKALKKENLHVALETTGNYTLDKLQTVIDLVDLFLYDFKHIDKAKLETVTGGKYDHIMNNLNYLSKHCVHKVIVRTPVIPAFNYDKETLTAMLAYVASLEIEEMHLLPYHPLGKSKWHKMHKEYQYESLPLMDKSELSEYVDIGKTFHMCVQIGG